MIRRKRGSAMVARSLPIKYMTRERMLLAGFISQQYGVITTIVLIAAAYLVVTLSIFVNPAMREMDRPSPAVAS